MMETTTVAKCMLCFKQPISGLQNICESCRAQRVKVCVQPKDNPACGYYAHRVPNENWPGEDRPCKGAYPNRPQMWCQPCDRCHFCGEVHEAAA